jgi:hypothetical protein
MVVLSTFTNVAENEYFVWRCPDNSCAEYPTSLEDFDNLSEYDRKVCRTKSSDIKKYQDVVSFKLRDLVYTFDFTKKKLDSIKNFDTEAYIKMAQDFPEDGDIANEDLNQRFYK